MESVDGNGGRRLVVTELSHIKDLVMQLEVHLGSSPALCKHLASQIFSLTERSIGLVTSANPNNGRKRSAADASAEPSPLSDIAHVRVPFNKGKKRKMMEKRRHQVRVSSAGGRESPVDDDGHSWRKYGQKEILGAKHPRGYYRCTHRRTQGCSATKQVQRNDEDPTLFDVIYLGTHTCVHKNPAAAGQAAQAPEHNTDARSLLQSLTVKTEGSALATGPFCFSPTPAPEQSPFSAPSTSENWGASPTTSDSSRAVFFPPFMVGEAEWGAQSELQEVVSALVAASAPEPALDMADELLDIDISSFFA